MTDTGSILNSLKGEAAILAVIPFLGALTAFCFEFGYLTYFDVPLELIDLGLLRILKATVAFSFVLAFLWALLARAAAIAISDSIVIKNTWLTIFTLSGIGFIGFMIWKGNYLLVLASMMWPLLGGLLYFLSLVFRKDGALGRRHPQISTAYEDGQKVAEKAEQISSIYTGPFSVLLIIFSLVAVTGFWSAKIDGNGWVLKEQPNFLLVRKYGDAYIFKEFDPIRMKIGDQIQILSLADGEKVQLKKIRIQHLSSKFGESNTAPD